MNIRFNASTVTRITAGLLLSLSLGYIAYLNNKPQLTPHEARTHAVLLETYQAASRALLFPALLPASPSDKPAKLKPAETPDTQSNSS